MSVIKMALPLAEKVILEELALRKKLQSMGVTMKQEQQQKQQKSQKNSGKSGSPKGGSSSKKKKGNPPIAEEEVEQCYFCNYILHMSQVRNDRTDFVTCLPHAIQHLARHKAQIKKCTLICEDSQVRE